MKKTGLSNRFSNETRHVWLYHYSCMICGMNQIDALHHIISPSIRQYVRGEHNESVYNSCPIHNAKCHIGKEAYLGEHVRELLKKTKDALTEMEYTPNEVDKQFLQVYARMYE